MKLINDVCKVGIRSLPPPPFNLREALRYSGGGDESLALECFDEAEKHLEYKVCFATVRVSVKGDEVDFGFASVKSGHLAKNLCGCSHAVIFAATVGVGIDRLIAKYNKLSPARAIYLQAIGSERAEALCDAFEDGVKSELREFNEGKAIFFRPRFSPGYGDLPLEFQNEIFRLLDCPRHIGVSLGESLLMTPSKSVTAIMGVMG